MTDERLRQLYQQGMAARDARGGTACAVAPDDLLALVRGELPEDRRLELLDVVMSSEQCRSEFELLRATELAGRRLATGGASDDATDDGDDDAARPPLTVVGAAPATSASTEAPPADVIPFDAAERARTRTTRRALPWWRRAAVPMALAATALLAVGLSQFTGRGAADADVTRGATDGVEPLAPAEEIAPGNRPTFVWRSVPGAARYAFELLDADGTLLHESATSDTMVALPAAVTLRDGNDYRWIVRASDSAGAQRGSAVRRLRVRGN